MDYGNLLSRSWRVVWDHKFMILLGFLAALGTGLGTGSNSNYSLDSNNFPNDMFANSPLMRGDFAQFMAILGAFAAGALCFLIIVGIILWLLRLTAEAGLIDAASRLDAGQKTGFREAMATGWQHLLSMVGLNLVLFGLFALVILAVVLVFAAGIGSTIAGAVASDTNAGGIFAAMGAGLIAILCCVLCGLAILGIAVGIVYTFAQRAIVLEGKSVTDSIRRGWEIIRANLGEVIILLVLFLILGFVVSAVIALVFLPLGALSFGPGAMRLFSGEALSGLDIFLMVVGGLALVILVAAIRSFYVAFRSTAFTLAFQEFSDKELPKVA